MLRARGDAFKQQIFILTKEWSEAACFFLFRLLRRKSFHVLQLPHFFREKMPVSL